MQGRHPNTAPVVQGEQHRARLNERLLLIPFQVFREQGIVFGYRHPRSSAADCLLSVFQMTNETLNIWTHFVPAWYLPCFLLDAAFRDALTSPPPAVGVGNGLITHRGGRQQGKGTLAPGRVASGAHGFERNSAREPRQQ